MAVDLRLAPTRSDTPASTGVATVIRVMLADDHAFMRRSLRLLLDGEEQIKVIAEASDLSSIVRHARARQPHVLVLDLAMSSGTSVEMLAELRKLAPSAQIVVLTMDDSPAFARQALNAGALGYVMKELADSELPEAVRAAARGEQYVSPRVSARLKSSHSARTDDKLTPREAEVLTLIALGHTSVEIAGKLQLSPRTVETHRARIHSKLGLKTRAELVHYALGRGLLRP